MVQKVRNPNEVHVLTLCGNDDCCPRVYFSPSAPADSCWRVVDDFGNEAFFGFLSLLNVSWVVIDGPAELVVRDAYDNEVYLTKQQLDTLRAEGRRLLQEAAFS